MILLCKFLGLTFWYWTANMWTPPQERVLLPLLGLVIILVLCLVFMACRFSFSNLACLLLVGFFFFFGFLDLVSLYSPGYPGTPFGGQACLELRNLLASDSKSDGITGVHHYRLAMFIIVNLGWLMCIQSSACFYLNFTLEIIY